MSEVLFKQLANQTAKSKTYNDIIKTLVQCANSAARKETSNISLYANIILLAIQACEKNLGHRPGAIDSLYRALELYLDWPEPTQKPNVNALVDAVRYHSVTEPKVVTPPKSKPAPTAPAAPWPFPAPKPSKPATPNKS